MKRAIIKLGFILIIAFFACIKFDYSNNQIINSNLIFSCSIDILGIVLAITAIFFTVIDRYKEKNEKKNNIEVKCFPILKEMCENVSAILSIVVVMFVTSTLEPVLQKVLWPPFLEEFDIVTYIFFSGFAVLLFALIDIAKSILNLVKGLFISEQNYDFSENEKYVQFLECCKQLNGKHFSELLEYTKTLIVKQHIEEQDK